MMTAFHFRIKPLIASSFFASKMLCRFFAVRSRMPSNALFRKHTYNVGDRVFAFIPVNGRKSREPGTVRWVGQLTPWDSSLGGVFYGIELVSFLCCYTETKL